MKKISFQKLCFIFINVIGLALSTFGATAFSDEPVKTPPATTTLTAPTGFTPVAIGQDSVQIQWETIRGATAYSVYRDGKRVSSVTGASYIDENLNKSTVYRYQLQAIYGSKGSPKSGSKCVRTWQEPDEGTHGSVICPPLNLKIVVAK